MGLDMYLYAGNHNGGGYDHTRRAARGGCEKAAKECALFDQMVEATGLDPARYPNMHSGEIKMQVAYWRKANAIHDWFVRNVQGGKDECQESYVGIEHLRTLLETCKLIREGVELGEPTTETSIFGGEFEWYDNVTFSDEAQEIIERELASQGGFFFGSTELDYNYVLNLDSTIEQLEPIIEDAERLGFDITYRASW